MQPPVFKHYRESFDFFSQILDGIEDQSRVSIAFNPNTIRATNPEMITPEGLAEMMCEFDERIGIHRIGAVHFVSSFTNFSSARRSSFPVPSNGICSTR